MGSQRSFEEAARGTGLVLDTLPGINTRLAVPLPPAGRMICIAILHEPPRPWQGPHHNHLERSSGFRQCRTRHWHQAIDGVVPAARIAAAIGTPTSAGTISGARRQRCVPRPREESMESARPDLPSVLCGAKGEDTVDEVPEVVVQLRVVLCREI